MCLVRQRGKMLPLPLCERQAGRRESEIKGMTRALRKHVDGTLNRAAERQSPVEERESVREWRVI